MMHRSAWRDICCLVFWLYYIVDPVQINGVALIAVLFELQFCMSGDSTLESMKLSIREVAKEDADERFVVSVSDANFDR